MAVRLGKKKTQEGDRLSGDADGNGGMAAIRVLGCHGMHGKHVVLLETPRLVLH
jgi:hypothetical protein